MLRRVLEAGYRSGGAKKCQLLCHFVCLDLGIFAIGLRYPLQPLNDAFQWQLEQPYAFVGAARFFVGGRDGVN